MIGAGQLPWLELFTTLCRSSVEENSHIIEESVEGMDFVSGALFEELGDNSTQITLRVGYYLPGVPLKLLVGGVWAVHIAECPDQAAPCIGELDRPLRVLNWSLWLTAPEFPSQLRSYRHKNAAGCRSHLFAAAVP